MAVEYYPYIEVTQLKRKWWEIKLIRDRADTVMTIGGGVNYARTEDKARARGQKMLVAYNKKYGNLADPYRIR